MCLVAVAAFFYTDVRTLATSSLGFANSFVIAVISYGGFVLLSGTMTAFAAFSLQVVLRRKDRDCRQPCALPGCSFGALDQLTEDPCAEPLRQ